MSQKNRKALYAAFISILVLLSNSTFALESDRHQPLKIVADTAVIDEHTSGLGADVVYECAGVPATVQSAVDLTRRGGRMVIIGLAIGDAAISPRSWLMKEIRASAALGYTHEEFDMVMHYVADGRVDLNALHSGTIGLAEIDDTLRDLSSGHSPHTKVLVKPS